MEFKLIKGATKMSSDEWIDVNDRLPEGFVDVLIHPKPEVSDECRHVGEYSPNNGGQFLVWIGEFGMMRKINVTHWMPLPKPPELK